MKQDTCTNVGKHALGYVFILRVPVFNNWHLQILHTRIARPNKSVFSKVAGAILHGNLVFF